MELWSEPQRLFLPELADHEHMCIDKLVLYLWGFHGFWMVFGTCSYGYDSEIVKNCNNLQDL